MSERGSTLLPPGLGAPAAFGPAALGSAALRHLQSGRLAEAEHGFRQAIAIDPAYVPGLQALGLIAWQQQRAEDALGYARRVVALAPGPSAHHLTLARLLRDIGRFAEAIPAYRAALQRDRTAHDARFELADALRQGGEPAQAAACLRTALRHRPDHAAGHYNLGNALLALGRPSEAIASYQAALALRPDDPAYAHNLAEALRQDGRLAAAEASLRALIAAHPAMAAAHYNLGHLLASQGQHDGAEISFRAALALEPGHLDALNHLGCTLRELERHDDAAHTLRQAVALRPELPAAHTNLGTVLRDQGALAAAEACFTTALTLAPGNPRATYNLATTLLLAGRLAEAWPLYEARWRTGELPTRGFLQPLWQGEALAGRTLLLHAEQGFGDTLQFCRFVTAAAAAARGPVVLEVQRPLLRLLAAALPGVPCIARGDELPAFAVQCPLMSLPLALGLGCDVGTASAGLAAPVPEAAQWRARLAALPGLRVGVVWHGHPALAQSLRQRDLPTAALATLAGLPGLSFVSLQKDRPPGETCPLPMHDWTADLHDFADTAALVAGLDLVIGVDTAVIHLAASLGRPTWLLNRFNPCWRWLTEREDSPWYPTLRQFRQGAMGDWGGVMQRVRAALLGLTGNPASEP